MGRHGLLDDGTLAGTGSSGRGIDVNAKREMGFPKLPYPVDQLAMPGRGVAAQGRVAANALGDGDGITGCRGYAARISLRAAAEKGTAEGKENEAAGGVSGLHEAAQATQDDGTRSGVSRVASRRSRNAPYALRARVQDRNGDG